MKTRPRAAAILGLLVFAGGRTVTRPFRPDFADWFAAPVVR